MVLLHDLIVFVICAESEQKKKKDDEEKKNTGGASSGVSEFPNRRRNMILAAIFAVTTMLGYAVIHGLVQVSISDDDSAKSASSRKPVGDTDVPVSSEK